MTDISTTSDQILTAARGLIITGGYSGFSYADISEVVGIRKASIHHHFPSKVDLVRTLVIRYREEAETGLLQMASAVSDPLQILKAYTGYWAECIEDSSRPFCVCALLAAERPSLPPEVAQEVTAYFSFLSSWLAEVIERGAQQERFAIGATAEVEGEMLMATVHGAMLSARAQNNPRLFDAIVTPTLKRLNRTTH